MKRRFAWAALACVITWLAFTDPMARAEVRRTTPQQAFTSGAMRSEQILREIAATLRSIDARVARLESTVNTLKSSAGDRRVP